jgi:septum formation inhibitor MinC
MNTAAINDFTRFVSKEVSPATSDLEKLEDKNRVHIQKLIYTNLVDRFDSTIDNLILDNCKEEELIAEAFKKMDQNVTEAGLLKLLLKGENLQDALETKSKDGLRLEVLRQRHSKKLATVFKTEGSIAKGMYESVPRVNPSNGQIVDKFKIQNKKIPHSLRGNADWLYSRRNTIVHGGGTAAFLENDRVQLKKLYKCEVSQTSKISASSIRNAIQFYTQLCEQITN